MSSSPLSQPTVNLSWPPKGVRPASIKATEDILREAKRRSGANVCSVAFSTGKDSVCMLYALRAFFEHVVPMYWYGVPDLRLVERSLSYYEQVFNMSITKLPHPWRFFRLVHFQWQPPHRIDLLNDILDDIPTTYSMDDLVTEVRARMQLDRAGRSGHPAPHATGIRASDTPIRAALYRKHGGFAPNGWVCYPVITWNLDDIEACLDHTGLLLPAEYAWIGRSLDGLARRYMAPLQEHCPEDYQRVLDDFPLADLEFFRAERVTGLDAPHLKPMYSHDPLSGKRPRRNKLSWDRK